MLAVAVQPKSEVEASGVRSRAGALVSRKLVIALFATVVGVVHVYPDLQFFGELGSRYRGIHFIGTMDETTYLSRVSRVLAGDYRLGNAMILEHRDDPFTYAPLPEYVLGTIGRLLGWSIVELDIAATAVLPALVFFLFFLLLREMTENYWLSVVGSLVLTLGQYLVAKASPLLTGRLYDPGFPHSLQFVRPVSPQFHYVVFVLALWLLYRVYARRGGRGTLIAAGLAWGLAFYLNIFFWTFLAGGIALWGAFALVRGERRGLGAAITLLVFGALMGSYYFVNSYQAVSSPAFYDASLRAGFIYTRQPILPALHLGWLLLFGVWLWKNPESVAGKFLLFFLLSGLICLNQQLLTGKTVQPFHWETQTNKAAMLLSFFVVVSAGLHAFRSARRQSSGSRPWRWTVGLVAASVVLVVTAHAALLQENYYQKNRERVSWLQDLGPALEWLKRATPPDSVVLANPANPLLSELISVYAQRFTYLSEPFFTVSLIPQREIDDRYLSAMWIFGFGEAGLQEVLRHTSGSLFLGIQVLPYFHRGEDREIRRHLEGIAERYRVLASGGATPAAPFRLDYLLVGVEDRLALRREPLVRREVYSDGRYQILEVERARMIGSSPLPGAG